MDALEKDLVVSSGPDSIGFYSGWARVWTQNPRVRVRMHNHHQMLKMSCRCGLWQSDVFTPVKNKRISKFEHRTDSKFWCPKRFAMSSQSWRRSTSRWQTVTPNQQRSRHHKTTGVPSRWRFRPRNQDNEVEGCPSEQESLEDNESEQAAEEEDVECGEPRPGHSICP